MTRIDELLRQDRGRPVVSVELWPPRTPEAAQRLEASLERLADLAPDFASITYGAAGSTRDRTHDLVVSIHRRGAMTAMAHLTCAAHRRSELVAILERYRDAGVENVLALRGDPPLEADGPLPDGELHHAIELAGLAKDVGGFCVAVAAHPQVHPEADDAESDLRHLAEKLDVADLAITQLFFDPEDYLRLVEGLARLGIDKPVIPGIMPITSARSLVAMTKLSGAPVPVEVAERVDAAGDSAEAIRAVGVEMAASLGERLLALGAPGLHFYTMNEVQATLEICSVLGLSGALDAARPGAPSPQRAGGGPGGSGR